MSYIPKVAYEVKLETTIDYLREALQMCPSTEETCRAYAHMVDACYLLQEHLHNVNKGVV